TQPRAPRRCFRGLSRARAARRREILSHSAPGGSRSTAGSITGPRTRHPPRYKRFYGPNLRNTVGWVARSEPQQGPPAGEGREWVAEFTIGQAKGRSRWLNPPAYPSTLGVRDPLTARCGAAIPSPMRHLEARGFQDFAKISKE